jgi:hypothetical protein
MKNDKKCFADSICSESAFSDFKERPRKMNKVTEHYRSRRVIDIFVNVPQNKLEARK